jgi:hypothetical protein
VARCRILRICKRKSHIFVNYKKPTILSPAAEDNIVDPVRMVLHGLDIGLFEVSGVPYSDDGVSSGRKQTLLVRIVLQRVDSRAMAFFRLLPYNERHLGKARLNA